MKEMANNLQSLKKELKSFAKRCKNFKYTESALLTFLLCGTVMSNNLFSAGTSKTSNTGNERQALVNLVKDTKLNVKKLRLENEKLINEANLELIELMEQGDRVTKNPWNSWQFGINYFNSSWNGNYKGRGDKNKVFIYQREQGFSKYIQRQDNGLYGTTKLNLIDTAEPRVPINMNASINPRVLEKGAITPPDKNVNVPHFPETVEFAPVTPNIPTINPSTVTITPVVLTNFWNWAGWTVLLLDEDATSDQTLDDTTPGTHKPSAWTVMDIGNDAKDHYIAAGVTVNIKKQGARVASIDSDKPSTSVTNRGTINLYSKITAGLEIQAEYNSGQYWVKNEGIINGLGDEQVALTLTPEQPNNGAKHTLINDAKIDMTGIKSTGLAIRSAGGGNILTGVALNDTKGEITLRGNNSYGIVFIKETNNNLKSDSIFQNKGVINVNGDESGGIAIQSASSWIGSPQNVTVENASGGNINIKGENSFGIYSEEVNATNNGNITILGNKDKSIGLRANKDAAVSSTPTLTNNGTITISSTGKENIGLYTKNAKVVNNAGKTINVTGGENIGIAIYGTTSTDKGEGTNAGTVTVTSAGSIGAITSNYGKLSNSGLIDVTGGNTSDNSKGTVGLVVGQTSEIDSSTGTINTAVTGNKSIGVYSNGTLKMGTSTINTNTGAINYFADDNGTIEIAASKVSTAITGEKSLLFYNGNAGTGKVTINGTLNATITGSSETAKRGTAFYYVPSSTGAIGSITGYNDVINYGTFGATDIQNYFNTTFNGTIGNLNLTMNDDSRLFVASKVKMNLSDTQIGSLAVTPNITGSNYKTFMLYLSEITINRSVNLDNDTDSYRALEISNSSIVNQNTMTGNNAGRVAMAQENKESLKSLVTLVNDTAGKITLNGSDSLAIYAKKGNIINRGEIVLGGKNSTGLYGVENTKVFNEATGKITLNGEAGTALYFTNDSKVKLTDESLKNDGVINGTSDSSVGMLYNPGTLAASVATGNATLVQNNGTISLTGDKNVGIYAKSDDSNVGYVVENNKDIVLTGDSTSLSNPNVGIYTTGENNIIKNNSGSKIQAGTKAVGIFGYGVESAGDITVGNGGVGIYSQKNNVTLNGGTITIGSDEAVGVYVVGQNQNVTANSNTNFILGDNSVGIVNANINGNNYILSNSPNVELGNNSVYVYSADKQGRIDNYTNIASKFTTSKENFGIYSSGIVNNYGDINLGSGIGNVGIFVTGPNGNAINYNGRTITIGESDTSGNRYSIGMAVKNGAVAENRGIINVTGDNGIGMYASGAGSKVINATTGTINLSGSNSIGMYLDDYAIGENYGTIQTVPNSTGEGIMGVYALNNAVIKNYGTIKINAVDGIGVYVGKNANLEGQISESDINAQGTDSTSIYRTTATDTSKNVKGIEFKLPHIGSLTANVIRNNQNVTPTVVDTDRAISAPNHVFMNTSVINLNTFNPVYSKNEGGASPIGMYVDTSGVNYTNPIQGLENLTRLRKINLIFGIEATQYTDSRDIQIGNNIIAPYNTAIMNVGRVNPAAKWEIMSGSLLWIATATQNTDQTIANVYLSKIPFNSFANDGDIDNYNFLYGLEEKYDTKDSTERKIFHKLNNLGKGEAHIFAHAVEEMKGQQYSNIQQRMYETGNILNKEFNFLKNNWRNSSKRANKFKAFGQRGEFKTDTAGVVDYTNNAYGVAYIHENEKIKLGNSSGWYAGIVNNQFKFKDIGHSKETQTIVKAGIFKTMSPKLDYNGSLTWTISGETFSGRGDMKRRYFVVDEVYQAKGNYSTYGAALNNEVAKEFRTSEKTSIRPYGALNLEYGKYSGFKENGPMALEVQGNDYFSVKPEVGISFNYKQSLGEKNSLKLNATAAYENEIGKLNDVKNRMKLKGTDSEYYKLKGEKKNSRGNGKFDLNFGWDNTKFGITVNAGYDTTGENFRSGIGFRAIY